jgi:parallel beta-helix repeat protein
VKRGGAGIVLVGCVLLAAWVAPAAIARKINVHPGKNAFTKAINRASNGDTLRIFEGRYRGGVEIDKKLTLRAVGPNGRPLIDGRCLANKAITVTHPGVVLRGLKVVGAATGFGSFPSEIYYEGVSTGRVEDVRVGDTCGDVEYGINVFQSGHLKIVGNRTTGFTDAGVYIGGITDTGTGALRVDNNESRRNNRGIIVEDSAGGRVEITENDADHNALTGEGSPDGIFLTNSDGVLIQKNFAGQNGASGIHLNSTSDGNSLVDNSAIGNPGPGILNEGTGNCGSGNLGSVAGNPLVPC